MARRRFTTWAEVAALDDDEVAEGFWDGFRGEPEPGDNRSDAYYHGWANGAVDGKHREKDEFQAALAHDQYVVFQERRRVRSHSV